MVGNPTAEHVRLQILDHLGRGQTDPLIVGDTDRFAEHLAMTTIADGRIAIGWDFNNLRQIEYIDARPEGIGQYFTNGNDPALGTVYDDWMAGMDGNDRLNTGDGNHSLTGGTGKDLLVGGTGADIFIFDLKGGRDTVTDFVRGQDKIDVPAWHYARAATALTALSTGIFADHSTCVTFTGRNTTTLTAADLIL